MSDDYVPHSTNQTAENVVHLDTVQYTHEGYDGGVSEVRLVEATYLGHTVRGFTTSEALRKLADRVDAEAEAFGLTHGVDLGSAGGEP